MIKSISKAFTIIELLVVIVIIGILASIALPVYSTVIEKGKTVKCVSNLRQIGTGMFLFAQDHNGYFPESSAAGGIQWGGPAASDTQQLSWMQQINTYMGNGHDPATLNGQTVFTCPSSSVAPATSFDKYYSYFNGAHAAIALTGSASAVKLQSIGQPVEQILSGDVAVGANTTSGTGNADKNDYTQNPINYQVSGTAAPVPFHSGAVNLLFADGHVSTVSWSGTLAQASSDGGYFDKTRMSTHYGGVTSGSSYLSP